MLRLQTVVNGETVKRIYPHLGYIHRGIEKMWESMTYPQTLALTDRLNYLSAMMHRHALVGVIEEAMGIELSDRIMAQRKEAFFTETCPQLKKDMELLGISVEELISRIEREE